jgi:hypothetical protein|nr:hypothetical protein [uncultured Mediterranean phage uvMED]|tara:strand:+ start:1794 stop:1976 length:183 start_codon:yes stop_codon:yes gene_type:complete
MSCKKIYYYEFSATLEEEFDSVEKAAGQRNASEKAVVKEITNKSLQHSIIKKEDRNEPNQ